MDGVSWEKQIMSWHALKLHVCNNRVLTKVAHKHAETERDMKASAQVFTSKLTTWQDMPHNRSHMFELPSGLEALCSGKTLLYGKM